MFVCMYVCIFINDQSKVSCISNYGEIFKWTLSFLCYCHLVEYPIMLFNAMEKINKLCFQPIAITSNDSQNLSTPSNIKFCLLQPCRLQLVNTCCSSVRISPGYVIISHYRLQLTIHEAVTENTFLNKVYLKAFRAISFITYLYDKSIDSRVVSATLIQFISLLLHYITIYQTQFIEQIYYKWNE